jgi:hypothetical protein
MGYVRVPVKVKTKKEENKKPKKAADIPADKNPSSELNEPLWSVVTFETCAASGLTYEEAAAELKNLAAKKVSGLCIITDAAAAKIAGKK